MKIKILLFFLFILHQGKAQINKDIVNDSLENKSYKYLIEKISAFYNHYDYVSNSEAINKVNTYVNAYIKKSRKDTDSSKIANGFYYLSEINNRKYSYALQCIDSGFAYNNNRSKKLNFLLYKHQGYLHYNNFKYNVALDSYVSAKKHVEADSKKPKSHYLYLINDYNIGLIMLEFGNIEEALSIFKKTHNAIIKNNFQKVYLEDYMRVSHVLSYAYLINKKIDSASHYNKLEIKETIFHKNINHYNRARTIEGFINYEKGNYKQALDSLSKYIPYLEENHSSSELAIKYLYLGKSYSKLDNWSMAIEQFKKVDTIIRTTKKHTYEIRENYRILHEYYKTKGDLKNNLLYLERRIGYDSILYNNNTYLKNTIITEYETPRLIKEKEALIDKLEKKDSKKSNVLYLLLIFTSISLFFTYYYYRKRSQYKKQFNLLIQEKTNFSKLTQINNNSIKRLDIPEDIINDILKKLKAFESNNDFTNNKLTLNSLSKKFKTNSTYLSRVINFHKGKNFSKYISNLRITYAVKVLKEQPKLREYTIKAIAFEVGFNNVDSFTIAFYKQTKIYPSYFIKQLKKTNINL